MAELTITDLILELTYIKSRENSCRASNPTHPVQVMVGKVSFSFLLSGNWLGWIWGQIMSRYMNDGGLKALAAQNGYIVPS